MMEWYRTTIAAIEKANAALHEFNVEPGLYQAEGVADEFHNLIGLYEAGPTQDERDMAIVWKDRVQRLLKAWAGVG